MIDYINKDCYTIGGIKLLKYKEVVIESTIDNVHIIEFRYCGEKRKDMIYKNYVTRGKENED